MLSRNQMLSFLNHDDNDVRELAANYFRSLADASPPETAAELWRAIDTVNDKKVEPGIRVRNALLFALCDVPQDLVSVDRAIELFGSSEIESDATVSTYFDHLAIDLLKARQDKIFPIVDGDTLGNLQHRIELSSMDAETVWQALVALNSAADAEENADTFNFEKGSRIAEALARHSDFVIPLAMDVLQNPQDRYWLQTWCVELLGRLRYAPAADLFIENMHDVEGDFLQIEATTAIGRLDATLAVPKLETSFANDDDVFFRMDVASALEKIANPLAEACMIRLLAFEHEPDAITCLASGLINIGATDGLQLLSDIIAEEKYEIMLADLKRDFVTLAKMLNYQTPELLVWQKEVESHSYLKRRQSGFGLKKGAFPFDFLDRNEGFEGEDDGENKIERRQLPLPRRGFDPIISQPPFKREAPKIGRNDPCPCGSGKKYKKCCGG